MCRYALTNLAYAHYLWLKAFFWKVYRTERSHYVKIHSPHRTYR